MALRINFTMLLKLCLGSGSGSDTKSNAECWRGSGFGCGSNKVCRLTEGGVELALGINFNMLLKPKPGLGSGSDIKSNDECWGGWTEEWTCNWLEHVLYLLREGSLALVKIQIHPECQFSTSLSKYKPCSSQFQVHF